jgi:two-component system chemotaxis response regulator CheB
MEKKEIIVIGGSAGSFDVLMNIIPLLPEVFPLPIVIIVHRKTSEESILTALFQRQCKMKVTEADEKMKIEKGIIYIAPAGYHLLVEKDHTFSLDYSEKVNNSRPNIDVTIESIVDVYRDKVIGILLSGANNDGAKGMELLKDSGGFVVIQSPETALFPKMPKAAEKIMKPDTVLSPGEIASFLIGISKSHVI